MTEVIGLLYFIAIIIAALSFLVTLSNLKFLNSLEDPSNKSNVPNLRSTVSVLVPARNEEANIGRCLRGLIAQDYASLEILVLDDRSTDRTSEIIQNIAKSDERVRMISGTRLPNGWTGKNWACHQLVKQAKGDLILFTDADTILSNTAIPNAVLHSLNKEVDLLTVLPKRIPDCIVEKLLFPFIDWASFCWIPMKQAHKYQNSLLSATFGQFMLFKREAYDKIGGHAGISGIPIDDFALGRATKKRGLRWMLFEGANSVKVLPYSGNIDAFTSVSRSVFPAIYHRISVLALGSVILLSLGFLPILTFAANVMSYPQPLQSFVVSATCIFMTAIPWFIVCLKFNHSRLTALMYPLAITLMVIVAFHSMISYRLGLQSWKKRKIAKLRE